jgi:polyketide cyclase/dehydrase/lipid transport protein
MATIIRDIEIGRNADLVWPAIRDVGAVDRLFPGFVSEVTMEPGMRHVRFAAGWVVHELIVSIDESLRRVAYASVGGRAKHHNASMQVIPVAENRCRILWTTDVLPDSVADSISEILNHAVPIMVRTLEAGGLVK